MVDDRHAVAGVEQLLGLHLKSGRLVSTTTSSAPGCASMKASLPLMKASLYSGSAARRLRHRAGGIVVHVNDDLRLLAALARDAAHAGRRADGVQVGGAHGP